MLAIRLGLISLACAAASTHFGWIGAQQPFVPASRPNFLLIMTDNHPVGTEELAMPATWARIYQQGVRFTNSFATTPECCPSRSSILTGMYAHNHGVRENLDPLEKTTFMQLLDEAGYVTGHIGKYLNSWPGVPKREYDYWVANASGGSVYNNPNLNVNGTWSTHQGYITYLLRDHALRFLDDHARPGPPFALTFSLTAPHDEPTGQPGRFGHAVPAPGHENLYPDLALYRPPNHNERDISDKPSWLQRFRPMPMPAQQLQEFDTRRRKQLQTLKSVDDSIAAILDRLERQGRLDNTVIIFLTDNGYLWGEHRITGVAMPYDNSFRIDLTLRYPPLVGEPRDEPGLVANIDIAPTILQLAGVAIPPEVDGRSLVALLDGSAPAWRDELLFELWPDRTLGQPFPPSAGVRTARYVYAEHEGDRQELYDFETDPHQLDNRVDAPAYAEVVADLRARLARLRRE